MIIVSYWKPSICKYYFFYHMFFMTVKYTAPIEFGQAEILTIYDLYITYMAFAYTAWIPALCQIVFYAYVIILRKFMYQDDMTGVQLITKFLMGAFNLTYANIFIHLAISWMGFKYIEAEIPREAN